MAAKSELIDDARREPLAVAVAAVLAEADADIAARRPVCRSSGRCCHFEDYGHRMYVTRAELVHFAAVIEDSPRGAEAGQEHAAEPGEPAAARQGARGVSLPLFFAQEKPEGCPYQAGGLCTAREARPLGCRVYFCDANAQSWQSAVYEKYHAKLQALHAAFGVPYEYIEWRAGLRQLMDSAGRVDAGSRPAIRTGGLIR
jgi:hypothetical protein